MELAQYGNEKAGERLGVEVLPGSSGQRDVPREALSTALARLAGGRWRRPPCLQGHFPPPRRRPRPRASRPPRSPGSGPCRSPRSPRPARRAPQGSPGSGARGPLRGRPPGRVGRAGAPPARRPALPPRPRRAPPGTAPGPPRRPCCSRGARRRDRCRRATPCPSLLHPIRVAQSFEDIVRDLGDLLAGVHDGEYSPFFVVLLYRLGLLTVSL